MRQVKARLNQIRREERAKTRKEQDHQKFILGGIVVKYFPEAYGFSEQKMCRILACAFKNRDIQNMIGAVVKDRKIEAPGTAQNVLTFCEKCSHGAITDNHGQKCPFPYLKTCDIITIRNRCKGKTSVAFLHIRL